MHFLVGALIVVGTLLLALQYMSMQFNGFWNVYSAFLLLGVPIGVMLMTYRFSTVVRAFHGLWLSIVGRPERDRELLVGRLLRFGREVRRERGAAASNLLDQTADPIFQHLGRHVLENSDQQEIETDAVLIGRKALAPFQCGDRVFSTLGNTAPAMGMIGTVIGLIQLLSNMQKFDELGSGMAIALLTTFYGLILGHVVYLPLARMIADHGRQNTETSNMIIDGMLKLARRRPLHEVQAVVGGAVATSAEKATTERATV